MKRLLVGTLSIFAVALFVTAGFSKVDKECFKKCRAAQMTCLKEAGNDIEKRNACSTSDDECKKSCSPEKKSEKKDNDGK